MWYKIEGDCNFLVNFFLFGLIHFLRHFLCKIEGDFEFWSDLFSRDFIYKIEADFEILSCANESRLHFNQEPRFLLYGFCYRKCESTFKWGPNIVKIYDSIS